MTITSTAFQQKEYIPPEYSYDGDNKNPPLTFSEVPTEAKSLLLIVDDPDAPNGTFTHWIVYNMSPATLQIPEGGLPPTGKPATNSFGAATYGGPAPPSGTHRYFFRLYALDITLPEVRPTDTRKDIDALIEGHVIDQAELMGLYSAL